MVYLGLVLVVVTMVLTSHGALMILCLQSSLEVWQFVATRGSLPSASVLVMVVVIKLVVE